MAAERRVALEQAIADVFELWTDLRSVDELSAAASPRRQKRPRGHIQLAVIVAMASHVHSLAEQIRSSMPGDLSVAHAPTIRAVFEATLTLAWLDEVDDALEAKVNADHAFRDRLRKSMASTRRWKDAVEDISLSERVGLPTNSASQEAHIEQLCKIFAVEGLYPLYRMLSHLSHPSLLVTDFYLANTDELDDAERSITIRTSPMALPSSDGYAFVVVECLLWAATVVDSLDLKRRSRGRIRSIAKVLGVPARLAVKKKASRAGRKSVESRL